jgi:midasin (ATPase involved in ribosome maturation)
LDIKKFEEETEKNIEEIVNGFKKEFEQLGINFEEKLKEWEVTLEGFEMGLRFLFYSKFFVEKILGRTWEEQCLIDELNLSPEEAKYVVTNPCLHGPADECSYYREHGECGPCCTEHNGRLFIKTSPNGKIKPVWKHLAALPKDTLFIDTSDKKKIEEEVKDFLEEP